MADRPTIDVPAVTSGWPPPWPNVAELADHLPHERWTLIGGLMVRLHAVYRGIGVMRPTNDVDIVLHVETSRGVPSTAATVLESLGYRLVTSLDPRNNTAHRFVRDDRDRHLYDAAVLLCCIDDPYLEREQLAGSDRPRLALLERYLGTDHPAWRRIPETARADGQAALRLLCAPD